MSRERGYRGTGVHVRGDGNGNAGADIDSFLKVWAVNNKATAPSGREGAVGGKADGRVAINAQMKVQCLEEVIDLGGASSALSTNNLLPANSLILGIVTHAVTDFSTPTTYDLGDEGSNTRFGDNITNDVVSDGPAYPSRHLALATLDVWQGADEKVKVTPNAAGTGKLHVAVFFMQFVGGLAKQ